MSETQLHWCTVCRRDTELERVPCPDGHGSDCPEVVCAQCCTVLVVGWLDAPGARRAA